MKKKVLIIGALGFTADCLIKSLENKYQVFKVDIKKRNFKNYYCVDVSDYNDCKKIINKINPNYIYNLAGSFTNKFQVDFKNNVIISKNILCAINQLQIKCKILLIGSAAEYGLVSKKDNPIKETSELLPISEYGLSKVSQTVIMKYYFKKYNTQVMMARAFNFVNKGISDKLFCGNLYKQIELFKKKKLKKIELSDLGSYRDYMDINNAVKEYVRIAEFGRPGEVYNVGSGKPTLTRNLCKKILFKEGINFDVVNEKKTLKKSFSKNVPIIYACNKKLRSLKSVK